MVFVFLCALPGEVAGLGGTGYSLDIPLFNPFESRVLGSALVPRSLIGHQNPQNPKLTLTLRHINQRAFYKPPNLVNLSE